MVVCENHRVFHVGDVIRKLRFERGWTIEELGERAGVNKATVSSIERGESNAREDTLARLAAAFGMTTAGIYAATESPPKGNTGVKPSVSNVEDGVIDVSHYTPNDIPVIAEGEASPQGTLFWASEGVLKNEVEDRISRPHDLADPRAFGVRVRGDSMLPVVKPGMVLIVSPNLPVIDGEIVYVELLTGERLIKIARRVDGGWVLESANPAYSSRVVPANAIGAIFPVVYMKLRQTRRMSPTNG